MRMSLGTPGSQHTNQHAPAEVNLPLLRSRSPYVWATRVWPGATCSQPFETKEKHAGGSSVMGKTERGTHPGKLWTNDDKWWFCQQKW